MVKRWLFLYLTSPRALCTRARHLVACFPHLFLGPTNSPVISTTIPDLGLLDTLVRVAQTYHNELRVLRMFDDFLPHFGSYTFSPQTNIGSPYSLFELGCECPAAMRNS